MTSFRRPESTARFRAAFVLVGIGCLFFTGTLKQFFISFGKLAHTDLSAWFGIAVFFGALSLAVMVSPAMTRRTKFPSCALAFATALLAFSIVETIPYALYLLEREVAFSNIVSVCAALLIIALSMYFVWRATTLALLLCGCLFALFYFLGARVQAPHATVIDILVVPAGVLLGIATGSVIVTSNSD